MLKRQKGIELRPADLSYLSKPEHTAPACGLISCDVPLETKIFLSCLGGTKPHGQTNCGIHGNCLLSTAVSPGPDPQFSSTPRSPSPVPASGWSFHVCSVLKFFKLCLEQFPSYFHMSNYFSYFRFEVKRASSGYLHHFPSFSLYIPPHTYIFLTIPNT